MASEIVPGLFVGDWTDGTTADQHYDAALCVVEPESLGPDRMADLPRNTRRMTIVRYDAGTTDFFWADPSQLNKAAIWINARLLEGKKVLVHCGAGIERSPLTVVFFLWSQRHMPWKEAYALVLERRPVAMDRTSWIPWEYQRDRLGL